MSQKTALKTVGILVLISVLVLTINAILVKKYPDKFGVNKNLQQVADTDSKNKIKADELPINEMDMANTTKNNRNVWSWPYDSAVPVYHHANLDIYSGKTKEEGTLNGITVYLAMDPIVENSVADSPGVSDPISNNSSGNEQTDALSDDDFTGSQGAGIENLIGESAKSAQATEDSGISIETIPNALIAKNGLQTNLDNILQYTKESFISLGAEVIILDKKYQTDMQKAAFIGQDILQDFFAELAEQNFKSERLEGLIEPLKTIQNSPENQQVINDFFPNIGVSKDQRLLLDVERQYTDRIFINIRYGESELEEISGSRVFYLGNETAAIGAKSETIDAKSTEKPAYIGYLIEDRRRFAGLSEKNISQLIPGLAYNSEEAVVEQIIPSLRLINLTSLEIEIGQKKNKFDLQILNSVEQQKIFAEAIANACYEFYCTDLP
ncbi:MAG TPA: hypothetical protein GXZ76_08830 [Clostridiaceae bacterium]|nr:hypothetical protein [Clostridiaceae bacterium]